MFGIDLDGWKRYYVCECFFVGIFLCILVGIRLASRDTGGDVMIKKKRNIYSYTIKKNDKPLPMMSKEQIEEALNAVERYLPKKKI